MGEAKILNYPAETVILKESDMCPDMFKIIRGNVEVYVGYGKKQETLIGILGEQDCFGEMGLLLHKPSVYTVVAYSDVSLLRITEGEMGDFVQTNHKNIIDIMRNMANTIMIMKFQVEMLVSELEEGNSPPEEKITTVKKLVRDCCMYRSIQEAVGSILPP
ncbi:MAG: cyclic nucleotide-binding domain-containing protein [Lachnospiraceae bacterium]|nr:cyclic nucleotide-binding domain-containing protein [Lachnospiraceae bacterium]